MLGVLVGAVVLGAPAAQTKVTAHAAFAASDQAAGPPAFAWLRSQVFAVHPAWPTDRSALQGFTVHWRDEALAFGDALPLPPGLVAAGEFTIADCTVHFTCSADGRESWEIAGDALPAAVATPLLALNLTVGAPPRTLDVPALYGNVAGAMAEGDRSAQVAAIGALQCGELTVAVQRQAGGIRAVGRSGGGLLLPAALLWFALHRQTGIVPTEPVANWRLRAFGGRDGDRAEAGRQLQRAGADALPALRALLHADEPSRVAAIDALLRLRAASDLPLIVAAADAEMPLSVAVARTAVRELWPLAGQPTRGRTLAALHRSRCLDAATVLATPLDPLSDTRPRWLALLAIGFTGLLGLWLRERARLA